MVPIMQILRIVRKKVGMQPGNIGSLEALAGISSDEKSRRAFWIECDRTAKKQFQVSFPTGEQVFHVGCERC
jgi:hypothetical protein